MRTTWKRRFFVLTPSRLVYYYSDGDFASGAEAREKNVLDLHSYSTVETVGDAKDGGCAAPVAKDAPDGARFVFEVCTPEPGAEEAKSGARNSKFGGGANAARTSMAPGEPAADRCPPRSGARRLCAESALDRLTWTGKIRSAVEVRRRRKKWFRVGQRLSLAASASTLLGAE
jgi:hypothetical protein